MVKSPIAYCYVRVSHPKGFESAEVQAREDTSIKEQVARTVAYYHAKIEPLGVALWPDVLIEPRVSAREIPLRQRPKGKWLDDRLLPGDHVIFAYFDRSVRCLRDWANLLPDWRARQITIHFVDLDIDLSTAHGQMIANLMASVAQWESDQKSERCKYIYRWLREHNRYTGGKPPCGYKVVGKKGERHLELDEKQMRVLAEIARLRDEEGMSFEQISLTISRAIAQHNGWRSYYRGPSRIMSLDRCLRGYRRYKEIMRKLSTPSSSSNSPVLQQSGNGNGQ